MGDKVYVVVVRDKQEKDRITGFYKSQDDADEAIDDGLYGDGNTNLFESVEAIPIGEVLKTPIKLDRTDPT